MKSPSWRTFVSTRTLVSSLMRVTLAPATAPLLLSTTWPLMAALDVWARAIAPATTLINASDTARRVVRHPRILCVIVFSVLLKWQPYRSTFIRIYSGSTGEIYTCQFLGGLTLGEVNASCQMLF